MPEGIVGTVIKINQIQRPYPLLQKRDVVIFHRPAPARKCIGITQRGRGIPDQLAQSRVGAFFPNQMQVLIADHIHVDQRLQIAQSAVLCPLGGQVPAAVEAVRVRPFPHCFLAIEEHQVDVILVRPAFQRRCEFQQEARRGAAVICAHELRHLLAVEVACDGNGPPAGAGKLRNDVGHRDGSIRGPCGELIVRNSAAPPCQRLADVTLRQRVRPRAGSAFPESHRGFRVLQSRGAGEIVNGQHRGKQREQHTLRVPRRKSAKSDTVQRVFMKLLLALSLSAALLAQEPAKKEKPTPKEKARELLDSAAETAPASHADVAAMAFAYIGENYAEFDQKKALEYLRRAFGITAGIPPDSFDAKSIVQGEIAGKMAVLSMDEAIEMLRQIVPIQAENGIDPRQRAIDNVILKLVEKKELTRAVEVLNTLGATANYPYLSAQIVFEKLPEGDGSREALFGYAMSAYTLRGGDGFTTFLGKHWKDLPRVQAEAAVKAVVENVLAKKNEDQQYSTTLSGQKGSVTFTDPRDIAFFDLMYIVQEIDPKRATEILDTRPVLKAALAKFPSGRESMGTMLSWSTNSGSGAAPDVQAANGLADSRLGAAMQLLNFDDKATDEVKHRQFDKALEIARSIQLPDRKASALGMIAEGLGDSDPAQSRRVLSQCLDTLKEIKDVQARQPIWDHIVAAAHELKDDKLAREAVGHSLDDAAELYRMDTDADGTNTALRDWWPSMNAYRHAVIAATKAFGVDADLILLKIADPDLNVLARLEMAATLLEHPRNSWMGAVQHAPK